MKKKETSDKKQKKETKEIIKPEKKSSAKVEKAETSDKSEKSTKSKPETEKAEKSTKSEKADKAENAEKSTKSKPETLPPQASKPLQQPKQPSQKSVYVPPPQPAETTEQPNASDIQIYDLSQGEITPLAIRVDIIQNTVDKLLKKQEQLQKTIDDNNQVLNLMTTSVQMLAEQHVNSRALQLLRSVKLIQEKVPFVKVNSPQRLEDLLKTYVKETGVSGVEEAIKKALPRLLFIGSEGAPVSYLDSSATLPSWITSPMATSKGGKTKQMLSGEVTVMGTVDALARALHRALRVPVLLRRFTSRMHRALYKSTPEESAGGLENVTVFLIVGNIETDAIPERYANRVLAPEDLLEIEAHLLGTFEGEIFIPDEKQMITDYLTTDPLQDPYGAWRILADVEYNGKAFSKITNPEIQNRIALLIMFRIMHLHNFNFFIGSCLNPLQ